jgi:hypothetical protein
MGNGWTGSEKKIARRVFEEARQKVLAKALATFKAEAAVADIDEMWAMIDQLRERRKEIEQLLDFRYSQLTFVFARLVLEGYLDEQQLEGLSEDKREGIRRYISFVKSR